MGTVFLNQPAASPPSPSYAFNGLSLDYSSQNISSNIDSPLHLVLLTTVWVVLLVTIIFGVMGNILVLYVYTNRNDSKTCTFFIKMLAIVDLTICMVLAPLELYQTTTGRNDRSKPTLHPLPRKHGRDSSIHVWEGMHLPFIHFFDETICSRVRTIPASSSVFFISSRKRTRTTVPRSSSNEKSRT